MHQGFPRPYPWIARKWRATLVHIALARVFFFMHDIAAFEAEATRFLDLNPNNADAVGWLASFGPTPTMAIPSREPAALRS